MLFGAQVQKCLYFVALLTPHTVGKDNSACSRGKELLNKKFIEEQICNFEMVPFY